MTDRKFRFGVATSQARSAEEWVARARRVEALGYSTLLTPDTLGPTFSPMPALAVAAAATRTLRSGTYVLVSDFRNPVFLAREYATLDFLSGGRFELGLGAGRPNAGEDYRKLGIPLDSGGVRVERLAEALGILKALLGGERVNAPGPHYRAEGADVFPRPVQKPRPPILVAASGKRLLSLAAREADIVTLAVPPDEGRTEVEERIGWLRRAAGERFEELEININLVAAAQEKELPRWLSARLGLDVARLARSGSPFVPDGHARRNVRAAFGAPGRFGRLLRHGPRPSRGGVRARRRASRGSLVRRDLPCQASASSEGADLWSPGSSTRIPNTPKPSSPSPRSWATSTSPPR